MRRLPYSALWFVLGLIASVPALAKNPAGITWFEVDKRRFTPNFENGREPAQVTIPAGDLEMYLKRSELGETDKFKRFRYQLEGYDPGWHEVPGRMRLAIAFYNEATELITQKEFPIDGTSPGWTGSYEGSPLVARSEVVQVPQGAVKYCVIISSAQSGPTTVGTLVVGSLDVSEITPTHPHKVLEWKFQPNNPPEPRGWAASGDRPRMSKVVPLTGVLDGWGLGIFDEDVNSHSEWRSDYHPVASTGSRTWKVEWLHCFSIGSWNFNRPIYRQVKPGSYLFRAQELTLIGKPTGAEQSLVVIVQPPVWQRPWFLIASGIVSAGTVLGAIRFVSWRKTQREIAHLRQRHALEAERARIARDIHDDVGATLTHISMLSQSLEPETASRAEMAQQLTRIHQATRVIIQAMDEIVWAVNPQNDHLDRLVIFFDSYAQEFLSSVKIDFRSDQPDSIPNCPVPSATRHNLFLAFKEALANAARHSGCRTIHLSMSVSGHLFTLELIDDGKGFDPAQIVGTGNGLTNMQRRMEALGGKFTLESSPGSGTKIVFQMPLPV